MTGIEQLKTIAYSHEENGIVERAIKELLRHIRAILYDKNIFDKWGDLLPLVQRILNATRHSTIGYAPAQILFGNAIDLDRGIILPLDDTNTSADLPTWLHNMRENQAYLIKKAQQLIADKDTAKILKRAIPGSITEYEPNSFVLKKYPDDNRPPTKFHTINKGPYKVVKQVGDRVTIQDLITSNITDVHVSQLTQFRYDPLQTNPKDVARHDYQEFFVEAVLAHKGDIKRKSTLTFKVRWLGYSSEDDSWVPWSELRNNPALHKYLADTNLGRLIPVEHRKESES
jgi:hypothetical protein